MGICVKYFSVSETRAHCLLQPKFLSNRKKRIRKESVYVNEGRIKLTSFARKEILREIIILSEFGQSQKDNYHVFPPVCGP